VKLIEGDIRMAKDILFTPALLWAENERFAGSGGVSHGNRDCGFLPAFYDRQSCESVLSRFANGEHAPIHVLEGVPEEWVVERDPTGRVTAVKSSVVAGFVRAGRFYTREEAARMVREER
jgi:hypothetical protein